MVANFADNNSGSSVSFHDNEFYLGGSSNSIYAGFNGATHPIFSAHNQFEGTTAYQWNGAGASVATIVADQDQITFPGISPQGGPCWISGLLMPTITGSGPACTDFDVSKVAASTATTLTFTITATVGNFNSTPGAGFDLKGDLDATSYYAGPTFETYSAQVIDQYAHAYNTTNVVHNAKINNAQDSGSSFSVTNVCVDTTVSSSTNNVETCTVTVGLPGAATDSLNTRARLRLHSNNRQVIGLTVQ